MRFMVPPRILCAGNSALWLANATGVFSSRDKRFLVRLSDGFPKVRFHDLRHTLATQLLLAGVHRKIAQGRLGHSTIATTMDIYGHVCDTMQKDAAAKIDVALRGQAASRASSRATRMKNLITH
jgi:integrase